jgi:pimeloyl-ACP methyl ester carboxylesterase
MRMNQNGRDKRSSAVRCPKVSADLKLADVPDGLAGDLAFRIFCTPELSQHRSHDHHVLTERARFHLRHARWERVQTPVGQLQTYVFDPDGDSRGTVLLVHGWTSEAAFMTAFIEPLRRSGLRVVAFDFPAHGFSSGRRTNLAECARALYGVCQHYGPIHAVVAHSFGGFVSLLVAEGGPPMPRATPIERFVLLACPDRLSDVTRNFGRGLGLSEGAQRMYERHLKRVGHRPVATFSSSALLRKVGVPTLVMHGRDDREVPFHNAEEIARTCPSARLMAFDGLGHRTLLYAPPVFRAVMMELAPERALRDRMPAAAVATPAAERGAQRADARA